MKNSQVLLDWLSFTISVDMYRSMQDILDDVKDFSGDWVDLEYGGMGYSHSALILGGGRVFWSPERLSQGVHISLSSSALSAFNLQSLLTFVFSSQGSITRCDIALDDFSGVLDMSVIFDKLKSKEVQTRFRVSDLQKNIFGRLGGQTIYLGSKKSETMVRFYDKRLEQLEKGKEVKCSHWVRCELQLRKERANALFYKLFGGFAGDWSFFGSYLLGLLDFKEVGTDVNKSRWLSSSWWTGFLQSVVKLRITLPHQERSIEQVKEWFEKSISVMGGVLLATPSKYFEQLDPLDWISEIFLSGQHRFSARHRSILASL